VFVNKAVSNKARDKFQKARSQGTNKATLSLKKK
jgi:hypothetical protein